ncbi:hypothetical protein BaRGS_00032080 [Batillaria attramentaria]|uniref:Uncharacterized protein n=1 Tax=Batillaria attramentaria TaxID=370345 RepID=A0ABD0JP41_9CAEN
MAVVQGADLKQNLKDSGIKVAADLTKRQRAETERVRSEGKFGYYKNGRLHVEDRRTPRDEQDPRERPDQRPSPDAEDERDAGDRQQQGAMLASSHNNDDRDDDDHSSQPTPYPAYRHHTLETPPRRPRDSPHAARGARDGHGQEDGARHRDASRTGGGRDTRRDRSRDMAQPLMAEVFPANTETFTSLQFDFSIYFSSFDVFHAPATKLSYEPEGRRSGGAILLARKTVSGFVTRVNVDLDNTVCVRIGWELTGDTQDLILLCSYVPPAESPYYKDKLCKCNIPLLEQIVLDVLDTDGDCHILVSGDAK